MDAAMHSTVGGLLHPATHEPLSETVTVGVLLQSFDAWLIPNSIVAAAAAAKSSEPGAV